MTAGRSSSGRELTRRGEEFALATVVWRQGPSSGQPGARAIITAGGELHGWIGGACAEPVVIREAQQVDRGAAGPAAAARHARAVRRGGAGRHDRRSPSPARARARCEVYIEPVLPTPHLVVVGRSPMAHTLADLARALGWRADLFDGPDFTAGEPSDARSMVVVATQGHGDEEAIEQAVAGLPGVRRAGRVAAARGESVLGYLADRGVPQHLLDRVRVPVGLDLGPHLAPGDRGGDPGRAGAAAGVRRARRPDASAATEPRGRLADRPPAARPSTRSAG